MVLEAEWRRLAAQSMTASRLAKKEWRGTGASLATVASGSGSDDVKILSSERNSDQVASGTRKALASEEVSSEILFHAAPSTPSGLSKPAAAGSSVGYHQAVGLTRQIHVAAEQHAGQESGAGQRDGPNCAEVTPPKSNDIPLRQAMAQGSHFSDSKDMSGSPDTGSNVTIETVPVPNQGNHQQQLPAPYDTISTPLENSESLSSKNMLHSPDSPATSSPFITSQSSTAAAPAASLSVSLPSRTENQIKAAEDGGLNTDTTVVRNIASVAAAHESSESSDSEWNHFGRRRIVRGRVPRRLSVASSGDEDDEEESEDWLRGGTRRSLRRRSMKTRSRVHSRAVEEIELRETVAVENVNGAKKTPRATRRSKRTDRKDTPDNEARTVDDTSETQAEQIVHAAEVKPIEMLSEQSCPAQSFPDSPDAFLGFRRASLSSHDASPSLTRFSRRALSLLAQAAADGRKIADDARKLVPMTAPSLSDAETSRSKTVPGSRKIIMAKKQKQKSAALTRKDASEMKLSTSKRGAGQMRRNEAVGMNVEIQEEETTEALVTTARRLRRLGRRKEATLSLPPRHGRTSPRQVRAMEATEDESPSGRTPVARRRKMKRNETAEEEQDLPSRRRRMPDRQIGVEESTGTHAHRTGRSELGQGVKRTSECETERLAYLQRDAVMSSPRRRQSPRGMKGNEAAASDGEVGTPNARQLRSSCVESGSVAKGTRLGSASTTRSSRFSSTKPASGILATRNQPQEATSTTESTTAPSVSVAAVTRPPLSLTTNSSVLQLPAKTPLPPPPMQRFTDSLATSTSSTSPTQTHLAVPSIGALLRPARVLRARPTARQVSVPGSRFSGATAPSADLVENTISEARKSDEKSQTRMATSDDDVVFEAGENYDAAAKGSTDDGNGEDTSDGGERTQQIEDDKADGAVDDGCVIHAWAAEVSSDSDASENRERPLEVKDGSVDVERGLTEGNATDDIRMHTEVASDDSEYELVIDDSTPEHRDDERSETTHAEKSEGAAMSAESPRLSMSVSSVKNAQSLDQLAETCKVQKTATHQMKTSSQAKTSVANPTKSSQRKLRDLRTENACAQNVSDASSPTPRRTPECGSANAATESAKRPSSERNRKGWKKLQRALSPASDDGTTTDGVNWTSNVESESDVVQKEDCTLEPLSASPSCMAQRLTSFVSQSQKKPVGQGSRLLAKLRRANSRPSASPSNSSRRFEVSSRPCSSSQPDSCSGLGSAQSDASRFVQSRVIPREEAKNIFRRGGQPLKHLQALGDWTSRPKESRVRSCGDRDAGGSVDPPIPGPLAPARGRVGRAPAARDLSDTAATKASRADNVTPERKATSSIAKPASSGEKSNTSSGTSSVEGSSGSTMRNTVLFVKPAERAPGAQTNSTTTLKGTLSCAARKPPPPLTHSLLEEVEDHRPLTKRPRLAHQAAVSGAAPPPPAAAARLKTPQRRTVKQESPQLPSFYQLLETPPTPLHRSAQPAATSATHRQKTMPPTLTTAPATNVHKSPVNGGKYTTCVKCW